MFSNVMDLQQGAANYISFLQGAASLKRLGNTALISQRWSGNLCF